MQEPESLAPEFLKALATTLITVDLPAVSGSQRIEFAEQLQVHPMTRRYLNIAVLEVQEHRPLVRLVLHLDDYGRQIRVHIRAIALIFLFFALFYQYFLVLFDGFRHFLPGKRSVFEDEGGFKVLRGWR